MEVHEGGNNCIFMVDSFDIWASLVAQMVKSLPAMWETWVRSLGWEDPAEKEIPHQYPCLENCIDRGARLWSMGSQRPGYHCETNNNMLIYSRNQHNIVKQSSSN